VFERLEQFRVALKQQILIAAAKQNENFRILKLRRSGWTGRTYFVRQFESSFAQQRVDATAQLRVSGRVIEFSINDQVGTRG
jgi:hypothetical protein